MDMLDEIYLDAFQSWRNHCWLDSGWSKLGLVQDLVQHLVLLLPIISPY